MISQEKLKEKLKSEEGFEKYAYVCSAGRLTVGYGYNLDAPGAKFMIDSIKIDWKALREKKVLITKAQAETLLEGKLNSAIIGARKVCPSFDTLTDNRQLVLVDMCYQMGTAGLAEFKNMLAAIKAEDYKRAAVEMLNSKWAKKDSPNRAKRNYDLMIKG